MLPAFLGLCCYVGHKYCFACHSTLEDGSTPIVGAAVANGHSRVAPTPTAGRPYTVSMAVPGSVIDNTQTMELATAAAGQIARTAAIFKIDEIVVIDDAANREPGTIGAGAAFLARVLQFMETPQYLRRCTPLAIAWHTSTGPVNAQDCLSVPCFLHAFAHACCSCLSLP